MLKTILSWLLVIIGIKLVAVLIASQFALDPRRDLATREELSRKYAPNAVFIGTSRTLYGVDSQLFDSLNHNKTRSFNMGLFSLPASQAFQIANRIIKTDSTIKNIFIELSALDYNTILLEPDRVLPDIAFRNKVLEGGINFESTQKIKSFLAGLNTSIYQMASIAPQIAVVKKAMRPTADPLEGMPMLRPDGHQPAKDSFKGSLRYVRDNQKSTTQLLTVGDTVRANQFYIDSINRLISNANAHQKKVTFYIPNNVSNTEFLILSQVIPFIPEANLIRLPTDSRLHAFFDPVNLFDVHHLNQKGARLYTAILQEEFSKKSENRKP